MYRVLLHALASLARMQFTYVLEFSAELLMCV